MSVEKHAPEQLLAKKVQQHITDKAPDTNALLKDLCNYIQADNMAINIEHNVNLLGAILAYPIAENLEPYAYDISHNLQKHPIYKTPFLEITTIIWEPRNGILGDIYCNSPLQSKIQIFFKIKVQLDEHIEGQANIGAWWKEFPQNKDAFLKEKGRQAKVIRDQLVLFFKKHYAGMAQAVTTDPYQLIKQQRFDCTAEYDHNLQLKGNSQNQAKLFFRQHFRHLSNNLPLLIRKRIRQNAQRYKGRNPVYQNKRIDHFVIDSIDNEKSYPRKSLLIQDIYDAKLKHGMLLFTITEREREEPSRPPLETNLPDLITFGAYLLRFKTRVEVIQQLDLRPSDFNYLRSELYKMLKIEEEGQAKMPALKKAYANEQAFRSRYEQIFNESP